MGGNIDFASNGDTATGYLATTASGAGPGLVVIQEWWGLVDHITDVCDRFAAEGFTALAPDLYHGDATSEPDEAGKLMMAMKLGRAAKDMSGAVDFLTGHDAVRGEGVGTVGFCMGGGLALMLAVERSDAVKACVPFYGIIPWESAQPDWSKLEASLQGHFAANDDMFGPAQVAEFEAKLDGLGKDFEFFVYEGTDHAFFNDTRPDVYDASSSATAWTRTLEFLRGKLG